MFTDHHIIRSYQVRGHLAAQIDPIGLNNMDSAKAKEMIIRSVTVDEKVEQKSSDPVITYQYMAGQGHWLPAATDHLYWWEGDSPPIEGDHHQAGECLLQEHWCRVHAHQQLGPDQLDKRTS